VYIKYSTECFIRISNTANFSQKTHEIQEYLKLSFFEKLFSTNNSTVLFSYGSGETNFSLNEGKDITI